MAAENPQQPFQTVVRMLNWPYLQLFDIYIYKFVGICVFFQFFGAGKFGDWIYLYVSKRKWLVGNRKWAISKTLRLFAAYRDSTTPFYRDYSPRRFKESLWTNQKKENVTGGFWSTDEPSRWSWWLRLPHTNPKPIRWFGMFQKWRKLDSFSKKLKMGFGSFGSLSLDEYLLVVATQTCFILTPTWKWSWCD